MRNKLKSTRTTVICCIIIGVLLIGLSVYAAFAGTEGWLQSAGNTAPTPTSVPAPTEPVLPSEGDEEALVLVLEVEKEKNRITVYEPDTDQRYDLFYTGMTDIRDRFGSVVAGTQIEKTAIVRVSFDAGTGRLYSLTQIEPDWYYERQGRVEINSEKGMLTVAGNNYRIGENPVVLTQGEEISLSELAFVDELTICGMADRVFYIERTKGHGVLQLIHADVFVGGSFYIDGKAAETVTGDMQMTVREGEYRFALENESLFAEKTLEITNGGVAKWDLSEYLPPEPRFGRVEFLLEPDGAELYIDNRLCENMAFAELEYGEHVLGLYKDGYTGWTGKITVSSEEMLFTVSLVPEPVATPTPEPTPTPESTPQPSPMPAVKPDEEQPPTPTQVPEAGEEKTKVKIIWYPTSVVSVDSVYVGTTDAAGLLEVELRHGTHVFELTRVLLDGNTMPEKFTADINAQSSVFNLLLTD